MKKLIYLEDALNIAMQYCPDDDGSCSKSGVDIREMLDELESLPSVAPKQRWIPCSERLPEEDGGLYLVTDYAKSINRRRMHLSRCYMNKDGFWSDVPIGYKVIAWMPLPEPYSERREE